MKGALTGPDGEDYFQSSMKDAQLPRLKGTLISVVPNDSGNALVLGLTDSTTPEVALLVHDLGSELTPGAPIELHSNFVFRWHRRRRPTDFPDAVRSDYFRRRDSVGRSENQFQSKLDLP